MLRETQNAWRAGLFGRGAPPEGIRAADPPARFAIHRGTVMESLVQSLGHAFPVARKIATPDNFRVVALAYIRAEPPQRPVLADYGAGFPDFLAGFPAAVADLPFLPDLARLEWALHTAYFAADAPSLAPQTLGAIAPEHLGSARLALHGAARRVSSAHPVWTAWRDEAVPGADLPGQHVLVARPDARVDAYEIEPGDAAFLGEIAAGATLEEAAHAAIAVDARFDFAAILAAHLQRGTFAAEVATVIETAH